MNTRYAVTERTCARTGLLTGGGEGDSSGIDLEIKVLINWFKDCATSATSTCDTVSQFLMLQESEDSSAHVSKCSIHTCDTDNCNDLTPDIINPEPLEQITCYTCKKSATNGVWDADPTEPDQPVCSEEHKKLCPLGVESCLSGNFHLSMVGETSTQEIDVVYLKDCSSSFMSTCEALGETMEQVRGNRITSHLNGHNV